MPSVKDVKGLLQITEDNVQSPFKTEEVLVLCDFACGFPQMQPKKLKVTGTILKLTIQGINSNQTIGTQIVELKLTSVHSIGSFADFVLKSFMIKNLNVRTEVELLQVEYPHLKPIPMKKYGDGDVKIDSWQDLFHFIFSLEYFEIDRKNAPIAVRLTLGWLFSVWFCSTSVNSRHTSKLLLKKTPTFG